MSKKEILVAVLGAGNMGTAIAKLAGDNGFNTKIWNYEGDLEPLEQIGQFHENKKYLSGVALSQTIAPEKDLGRAVAEADVIFFILPSNFISDLVKKSSPHVKKGAICVDVSKGFDEKTLGLVPDVIAKGLPKKLGAKVLGISGPAIARDMATGAFTAMNIYGKDKDAIKTVQQVLESDHLRLSPSADPVGAEVAGSLKNVYAIALGVCDGLGFPMNTKAVVLVSALQEMNQLIKKMKGSGEAVFDLAGLGDLIATSLSPISRNRRFGEFISSGMSREEALKKVGQTVEGVSACRLMLALGKKFKINLPLAQAVYNISWEGKPARAEINDFLKNIK